MMNDSERNLNDKLTFILKVSAFACLFAWAWQHLLWQGPYAALIGKNGVFLHLNDPQITLITRLIGLFYLVSATLCWTQWKGKTWQIYNLIIASLCLCFMFFCRFVQVGYAIPNFVEHGGQMLSPLLLLFALKYGSQDKKTLNLAIFAFFTTFVGHGIYASGLYPTPNHFYELAQGSLGLSRNNAGIMITVAGYLDFFICLAIFIKPLRSYCLIWAIIWGALTALARPVAGMSTDLSLWGLDQFLQQAIWRTPHALIPFFLFCYFYSTHDTCEKSTAISSADTMPTSETLS